MRDDRTDFAVWLAARGWTQAHAARVLGLSRALVCLLVSGRRTPNRQTLLLMSVIDEHGDLPAPWRRPRPKASINQAAA